MEIHEEFFDNLLLDDEEIKSYSYEKCRTEVEKKIKNYSRAHFKFINLIPPKITVNYEFRYESFTPKKIDKTGNYVADKIDSELEALEIYNALSQAWNRLSYNERVYTTEVLIYKKSENYALDHMKDASRYLLDHYIKKSCVIKLAMAFGVAE